MTLAPATAASPGTVAGLVTAADDGTPIQGITVCAIKRSSTGGFGTETCEQTGADGRYSMTLPVGTYSFRAEEQYLYGDWVQQDYHELRTYTVTSGATRTANFAMVRGAKITGYLQAPGGGGPGHGDMAVHAFRVDSKGRTAASYTAFSNTTSGGYFEVSKLPAGRYRLQSVDGSGPPVWAGQWYPDSPVASGAEILTVTTGQHLSNRNFPLTAPGSITVQLLKPTGTPIGGSVEFYDADGRLLYNLVTGYGTSKHTIYGLHPGSYKVRAEARTVLGYSEWLSHKYSFSTANPVRVQSGVTTQRILTFHYRLLANTRRPVVSIHRTYAKSSRGEWSPKPSRYNFDWVRDGVVVKTRSGSSEYDLSRADVGHRLKTCVTASRDGYAPRRTCSGYSKKVTTY